MTTNPLAAMTPAEYDRVITQLRREGLGYRRGESRSTEQRANARAVEILDAYRGVRA